MTKCISLLPIALLLTSCMATTPTQTSTRTQTSTTPPGEDILAWYCYGSSYDAKYEKRNHVFYAYSDSDGAFVNVHGDDVPAEFGMDGLDAQYAFGQDARSGRFDYLLTIQPDGRAEYGDLDSGSFRLSALYYCRKAVNSR